jgi:hypothetical protein
MALAITTEQRDAIYEEVLIDLSGIGDLVLLLDRGEHEAARDHGQRFIEDLRLLDDLGWMPGPGDRRDEFVLTMPPAELARALRRLNDNAATVVYRHVVMPIEEREQTQRAVTAMAAYSDLLAQLIQAELSAS